MNTHPAIIATAATYGDPRRPTVTVRPDTAAAAARATAWATVRGEALARLSARLRDAMVRGERVALVITSDLASVVYRSTVVADWVPLLDPAPLDRSTLDRMELIRGEGDPVALFDSWA